MGLDMYLKRCPRVFRDGKKINLAEYYPSDLAEENKELYEFLKPYEVDAGSEFFKYKSYCIEVGYWRKANQIHKWFVDKVQDGVDECQTSLVAREQLEELLRVCKVVKASCKLIPGKVYNGTVINKNGKHDEFIDGKVIDRTSVAEQLLPTESGFFFGSTYYDEYYMTDINDTIKILTEVLETTDFNTQEIYYHASW